MNITLLRFQLAPDGKLRWVRYGDRMIEATNRLALEFGNIEPVDRRQIIGAYIQLVSNLLGLEVGSWSMSAANSLDVTCTKSVTKLGLCNEGERTPYDFVENGLCVKFNTSNDIRFSSGLQFFRPGESVVSLSVWDSPTGSRNYSDVLREPLRSLTEDQRLMVFASFMMFLSDIIGWRSFKSSLTESGYCTITCDPVPPPNIP